MSELFFLSRLEASAKGLSTDIRFAHPFQIEPVEGVDAVMQSLRALADALGQEVHAYLEFQGKSAAAVAWKCGEPDQEIHGVTLSIVNADEQIRELRIALRPVLFLESWRDRLLPWLKRQKGGWDVSTVATEPDSVGNDKIERVRLPFPLSDEVQFHSPALVRPIQGADAVSHIVDHAKAAYGDSDYGPSLISDSYFLRAYTAKGTPMEIVSIAHLDGKECIDDLAVFMQPWPNVMLFRHRLRARLGDYLDATFYETA